MELNIELEFLQEINLSNNYLNYIHPNAFKELTKLKNLYIDNNEVSFTFGQSEQSFISTNQNIGRPGWNPYYTDLQFWTESQNTDRTNESRTKIRTEIWTCLYIRSSMNQNCRPIIFLAENISNKMGENQSSWWLKLSKDRFKDFSKDFSKIRTSRIF